MTKDEIKRRVETIRNGVNELGPAAWAELLFELQNAQSDPVRLITTQTVTTVDANGHIHERHGPLCECDLCHPIPEVMKGIPPKPKTRGEEIAEKIGDGNGVTTCEFPNGRICSFLMNACETARLREYVAAAIDAARAEMREQTKEDAVQAIMGATWYEHAGTKAALADRIRALP